MSEENGADDVISGLAVDEAVTTVVDADDARDSKRVRTVLTSVSEDGVVSRDAVEKLRSETSEAVSTCESRAEQTDHYMDYAREEVPNAPDLSVPQFRLDSFEDRMAAVERRVDGLRDSRQSIVAGQEEADSLYEVAARLTEARSAARECRRITDQLEHEVESFLQWLATTSVRWNELEADTEALVDGVQQLANSVDQLASIVEDGEYPPGVDEDADPGVLWFELTIAHRTKTLALDDLRTELTEFRQWESGDDVDDEDRAEDIENELSAAEQSLRNLRPRLNELADDETHKRFDQALDELDTAVTQAEPPVDWGSVQAIIDELRQR